MIIYYKLPSYPKATATLPFAKISAMRKKHLVKYYTDCVGVKRMRKDVRPEKLQTKFKLEKSSANYGKIHGNKKALQRETDIQKIMKEVTGHFGALGRRIHSSRKERQCSSTEEKRHCVSSTDGRKKFSEDDDGAEKVSADVKIVRLVHSPVHIS
jgi:hypothetical protein